jgi:protoporphyrinogen oxidase
MAFEFEGFEPIEDDEDPTEGVSISHNSTGMYSFEHGIAEIPLALAKFLGDKLQTETVVTDVRRAGELFEVNCRRADNSTITYMTDAVILATPSVVTLDIAREILDKEQAKLLDSVNYSPYATVALFSEEPIFNQGFDLSVPDGLIFTDIYDATWVSRKHDIKPSSQKNWITLIYASPASYLDTTFLKIPATELMKTIFEQLDNVLPGSSALVKDWKITQFQYGYPVMLPGSYQRMSRLEKITGNGLFLAGDYLIYPTFEAAASSGQLAAEKVIDWLED